MRWSSRVLCVFHRWQLRKDFSNLFSVSFLWKCLDKNSRTKISWTVKSRKLQKLSPQKLQHIWYYRLVLGSFSLTVFQFESCDKLLHKFWNMIWQLMQAGINFYLCFFRGPLLFRLSDFTSNNICLLCCPTLSHLQNDCCIVEECSKCSNKVWKLSRHFLHHFNNTRCTLLLHHNWSSAQIII